LPAAFLWRELELLWPLTEGFGGPLPSEVTAPAEVRCHNTSYQWHHAVPQHGARQGLDRREAAAIFTARSRAESALWPDSQRGHMGRRLGAVEGAAQRGMA